MCDVSVVVCYRGVVKTPVGRFSDYWLGFNQVFALNCFLNHSSTQNSKFQLFWDL